MPIQNIYTCGAICFSSLQDCVFLIYNYKLLLKNPKYFWHVWALFTILVCRGSFCVLLRQSTLYPQAKCFCESFSLCKWFSGSNVKVVSLRFGWVFPHWTQYGCAPVANSVSAKILLPVRRIILDFHVPVRLFFASFRLCLTQVHSKLHSKNSTANRAH